MAEGVAMEASGRERLRKNADKDVFLTLDGLGIFQE